MKRNKIILWLLATSLFLTISQSAFGQEIIRGNDVSPICDTSIIRTIGNDTVLIYNRTATKSSFMLVCSGAGNAAVLDMENLFVNDFEIVRGRVYFCGYKAGGEAKKAIFGYFNSVTFPNSTVNYYEMDTCKELRKLDFYRIREAMFFPDYEDHIIMTGTTTGGRSDVLVDRLLFSPIPVPPVPISYSCDIHYSLDESESFDDIAVTKNFVVVSTRRKLEGLTVVDFWHFKKPTSIGNHIFYPNFGHLYLASPAAESPVILEHISADRYAAAYKIEGYPVYTRMAMVQADASIGSVTNSVEIFVDNNLVNVPMDLKYNGEKDVLDILARRIIDKSAPDAPPLMHIYHVTQDVINHIAPMGDGTVYPNNLLWSIDPTKSSPYFVASGSDYWFPRYFKYLTDQWKNCPVPFEYRYEVGKPEAVLADKKIEWTWCKDTSIKYERDPESMAFPWICPAK